MEIFEVFASFNLLDNLSGPLGRVNKAMASANATSGRLADAMGSLTKKLLPVALAAGVLFGALTGTAMATIETQAAMGELASVGVQDFAAMESAATDFSNRFSGTTKPDFVRAAYDIKSGISSLTDAGVAGFTELSALTAKATKSTVAEMTSLFATGYGIFKAAYSDMGDFDFGEMFSAGIAASVQGFKTTGSGMAQALSALGGAAVAAGVSLEEQLGVLGALQATMSGSEAATKYKAVLTTAGAAGKKLGLDFLDANNQLRSMPEILSALKSKYGETIDAIEKQEIQKAFGTIEAVAFIDSLYSRTGDLQQGISGVGQAMKQGQGFTAAMAQTMNQDLGATLQKLSQRWHNLVEIIGSIFAPALQWVTDVAGSVTVALQRVAGSKIGRFLLGAAGIVAAAVVAFTAFSAAVWGVSLAVPFLTAGLGTLAGAMAAVSWPVWLIVGAVAALALAWRSNFGGMAEAVSAWWSTVMLVWDGVKAAFAGGGTITGDLAQQLMDNGLAGWVQTAVRLVQRLRSVWSGVVAGFRQGVSEIGGLISPIRAAFEPVVAALAELASLAGGVLADLFGFAAGSELSSWTDFGMVLGQVVAVGARAVALGVRMMLTPLQLAGNMLSWLVGLLGGTATWSDLGARLQGVFSSLLDAFKSLFPSLYESGRKLVTTMVDGIKSVISAPYEAVKSGLAKVRNLLPFSDAKEGPLSALTLSGTRIMSTLGKGIANAAPSLAKTTGAALAGVAAATMLAIPSAVDDPVPPGQTPTQISSAASTPPAGRGSSAIADRARSGGGTTIHIGTINLPSVKDADGFLAALQRVVEDYDLLPEGDA